MNTSLGPEEMTEALVDASSIPWFELNFDFHSVSYYIASVAMIFGGVVPYWPQYREIQRTENSSGFSTYVCLALIAANSLRIIFWFGKHFEIPLLIQSLVMLVAMFLMIEICIRTRRINSTALTKHTFFNVKKKGDDDDDEEDDESDEDGNDKRSSPLLTFSDNLLDLNCRHFWQWTDLVSYIEFTAVFMVLTGSLMYIFMDYIFFVEFVGYLSLTIEALLGFPQLVKNFNNKSTLGMSLTMVLLWTGGDLFKTGYFFLNEVPKQFIVCGILQVSIDLAILAQVSLYHPSTVIIDLKRESSTNSRSLKS